MTAQDAASSMLPPARGADRRERGMARWQARSRLIRRLRLALPAAIGVILLALVGWIGFGAVLARLGDGRPSGQALIHMTNAHFFGQDNAGRPYVLSAAEASRDDADLKLIGLKLPTLTLDGGDGRIDRLTADRGVYREDTRTVRLMGNVMLRDASGHLFRTDQAFADTVQGVVLGSAAVSGAGPTGAITANSFAIYDKGARVVFRGEVHSRLKRD